ncbi:uncharacterized protein TNCV_784421 [Trichonephila clavipes]|nr:uncharacterized protein TNCV_784421 [Trichonephila clavipes]
MIQNECFSSESDDRLKALKAFRDAKGILRLKTKINNRKDNDTFLKPAMLPPNHEVIKRIIVYAHEKDCHAGGADTFEYYKRKVLDFTWKKNQLILGRDGEVHLVRVQTSNNELFRLIQRIYPLEIGTSDGPQYLKSIKSMDHSGESDQFNDTAILEHSPKFSRSGRRLKVLSRGT